MIAGRNVVAWISLPVFALGCDFGLEITPVPPAEQEHVVPAGAAMLIGTGDIAVCGGEGDELTAALVDSVLGVNSAAGIETAVFTPGDHAYPSATESRLTRCFTPSWGDPNKGIMKLIRPSIGNHDYQVDRGAPYYEYFGLRAGEPFKGYYSYDLGGWHVVVLNSELVAKGPAVEISRQEEWLEQDLLSNGKLCTVAYFHRPLFTSAARQGNQVMRSIWDILYEGDVDLVLNGHDHHYERFSPQDPSGAADSAKGIEQIIIGTGGGTLRGFRSRLGLRAPVIAPNSVVRIQGRFGVLMVALGEGEYNTAFLEVDGRVWDSSSGRCH